MTVRSFIVAIVAVCSLLAGHLDAQAAPSEPSHKAPWSIASRSIPNIGEVRLLRTTFDDGLEMGVFPGDTDMFLSLSNARWSLKPGALYHRKMTVGTSAYDITLVALDRTTMTARMSEDFLQRLWDSKGGVLAREQETWPFVLEGFGEGLVNMAFDNIQSALKP